MGSRSARLGARGLLACLAAAALLVPPALADTEERRADPQYSPGVVAVCSPHAEAAVGGVCFPLDGREYLVQVGLAAPETGARYRFVGPLNLLPPLAPERVMSEGSFCRNSPPLWVPVGATRLEVAPGPLAGESCTPPSTRLALSGTVTATMHVDAAGMQLTSTAFANFARIPQKHTCAGLNRSPKLEWSGVPANAQELVLIVEDPDTPFGTIVHWVVYGIAPAIAGFEEGAVPAGVLQGSRGFGSGYGGPCPPNEHGPHRYVFRLYALESPLGITQPGATADQVRQAMAPVAGNVKVLQAARLVGTYSQSAVPRATD